MTPMPKLVFTLSVSLALVIGADAGFMIGKLGDHQDGHHAPVKKVDFAEGLLRLDTSTLQGDLASFSPRGTLMPLPPGDEKRSNAPANTDMSPPKPATGCAPRTAYGDYLRGLTDANGSPVAQQK